MESLERLSIALLRQIKEPFHASPYAPDFKATRETRLHTIWKEMIDFIDRDWERLLNAGSTTQHMPHLLLAPNPYTLANGDGDVTTYNTLYACLALTCMQSSALRILYYTMRFLVPRIVVSMTQDVAWDQRMHSVAMESLFPGKRTTWLSELIEFTLIRSKEMNQAFDPWKKNRERSDFPAFPQKVMDSVTLVVLTAPVTWRISSDDTIMLSYVLSPYLGALDAVNKVKEWLERVSEGCTRTRGWTWMVRAAQRSRGIISSPVCIYNWIRGLWTYCLLERAAPDMNRVPMAFYTRHEDAVVLNRQLAIGTWIDAACFVAAINLVNFESDDVTDRTMYAVSTIRLHNAMADYGPFREKDRLCYDVLDFLNMTDAVRGHIAYAPIIDANSNAIFYDDIALLYLPELSYYFERFATWMKRIIDRERTHRVDDAIVATHTQPQRSIVVVFRDLAAYRQYLRLVGSLLSRETLQYKLESKIRRDTDATERYIFQEGAPGVELPLSQGALPLSRVLL